MIKSRATRIHHQGISCLLGKDLVRMPDHQHITVECPQLFHPACDPLRLHLSLFIQQFNANGAAIANFGYLELDESACNHRVN